MRFYYVSDLHHDYNGDFIFGFNFPVDAKDSCLILAGDISSKGRTINVLERFASIFKYVVAVAGNHEWYGLSLQEHHKFAHDIPNLRFLQNAVIELEGVSIAGTTLWHELDPISAIEWRYFMNDGKYIKDKGWKRLSHITIDGQHALALKFIAEAKADILITHHGLSDKSISSYYKGKQTNKFYVTHKPELLSRYKHYVHGHVHSSFEYEENGCQVHCNPLGYATDLGDNMFQLENDNFSFLKHFDV